MNLDLGFTSLIIKTCKKHGLSTEATAYVLATCYHETNHSMMPVEEAYYLGLEKAQAHRKKLRYYPWHGRGFVQLTWEDNYKRAKAKLGIDFTGNPSLAMSPEHSAEVTVIGMRDGWFTGKKLSDYIGNGKVDFLNARRIVNGTDKAKLISDYATEYLKALRAKDAASPLAPNTNWIANLLAALTSIFKKKGQ